MTWPWLITWPWPMTWSWPMNWPWLDHDRKQNDRHYEYTARHWKQREKGKKNHTFHIIFATDIKGPKVSLALDSYLLKFSSSCPQFSLRKKPTHQNVAMMSSKTKCSLWSSRTIEAINTIFVYPSDTPEQIHKPTTTEMYQYFNLKT